MQIFVIKECAEKRNKGYCSTSPGCTVLRKIPAEDVLQVTAGHNYVAFLLKDHRVARLRYEIVANTIESTAPTDKNESGPGSSTAPATTTAGSFDPASASANAAANAANRTAKIRRIMMTRPGTRSGGFCRTGVFQKSYSAENGDDLPVLELNALRDLAFIIESYLFHICFIDQLDQAKAVVPPVKISRATRGNSEIRQHENEEQKKSKLRRFFKRSNSISYSTLSDAVKHHAFTYTAADVLPLSVRPYLLNSEAERDVLFALPPSYRTRSVHRRIALEHGVKFPAHHSLSQPPLSYADLQNRLFGDDGSKTQQIESSSTRDDTNSDAMEICTATNDGDSKKLSPPIFNAFQKSIGRWNRTISFVAKNFHDDITKWFGGDSSHSVLIHKTGVCSFNVRYSQFRKQMDRLKSTQTKDLVFSQVPREKYVLLQQTFRQLNHHYVRRTSGASGTSSSTATPSQITNARTSSTSGPGRTLPLASHKVKVTFRDEPGEGTGVARHFYAAVAEALTTVKHLPALDNVNEDGTNKSETKTPEKSASVGPATPNMPKADDSVAASGRTLRSSTTSATSTPAAGNEAALMPAPSTPALSTSSFILPTGSDTQTPLFYKAAAKTSGGFYTPITGLNCSSQRLNAFRNVGRLIGICLQHMEIFPLPLSRYVLKYILGRNITWYDLAFFDSSLFDSLRSIVYNENDESYQSQEFFNQLEMTFAVDLPAEEGGGTLELKLGGADISNRLIGRNKASLDAMRRGVFDVLPADALINLTAEDMRLILCGQDINLQILQSFTKFFDESSAPANVLAKYKKNFWIVVNKFSNAEKQDLCFFWTGSPNLPSTEEGFQPLPTIMCDVCICVPQQQSIFVQVWKMALKHQHLHQDKSLRDVPNEHWTATN
uniref:HECT domain-containing protein n=1 Tax=Meloidogyne enterolobii TaxID=390850 RepID=A0A6V7X5N4_MELEN|nr:unnamed protein product [Meloidogyne enterolobii]